MTTPSDTMKCRWCSWSTLKWRQGKDGRRISGWRRLDDHIFENHPDQHEELKAAVGEDADELLDDGEE